MVRTSESEKIRQARYRLRSKITVLRKYSKNGVLGCVCCGENNITMLSLDHINGGGTQHRKCRNGTSFYPLMKSLGYPEGYQTMCFNCNYGKYKNGNKTCPHNLGNTMEIEQTW